MLPSQFSDGSTDIQRPPSCNFLALSLSISAEWTVLVHGYLRSHHSEIPSDLVSVVALWSFVAGDTFAYCSQSRRYGWPLWNHTFNSLKWTVFQSTGTQTVLFRNMLSDHFVKDHGDHVVNWKLAMLFSRCSASFAIGFMAPAEPLFDDPDGYVGAALGSSVHAHCVMQVPACKWWEAAENTDGIEALCTICTANSGTRRYPSLPHHARKCQMTTPLGSALSANKHLLVHIQLKMRGRYKLFRLKIGDCAKWVNIHTFDLFNGPRCLALSMECVSQIVLLESTLEHIDDHKRSAEVEWETQCLRPHKKQKRYLLQHVHLVISSFHRFCVCCNSLQRRMSRSAASAVNFELLRCFNALNYIPSINLGAVSRGVAVPGK